MSEDQSHSGSRWEPAPAGTAPWPGRPQPTPPTGAPNAEDTTVAAASTRSVPNRWSRRSLVVAAVLGAVLLLGGAAAGHAVGHATATTAGASVHERGAGGPGGHRGRGDGDGTSGQRVPGLRGTGTPAGGTST